MMDKQIHQLRIDVIIAAAELHLSEQSRLNYCIEVFGGGYSLHHHVFPHTLNLGKSLPKLM
jgi:hypothetical protein